MAKARTGMMIKRVVDAVMTVFLLFLMAYQVTGEALHEWIGIVMTVLVILHQFLNRRWFGALFRGKYNAYRILTTVSNCLLLCCFAMTAFCGMSMSGYAVPFLYGMAPVSFARQMHLSLSHWTFIMMGLHLGLHLPLITAGLKLKGGVKSALNVLSVFLGGFGLFLFLRGGISDYLFFRVPFAFLDYDKAGWLVILENLLMLLFWALVGSKSAMICKIASQKTGTRRNLLSPLAAVLAAVILGIVLTFLIRSSAESDSFGNADWSMEATQVNETSAGQDFMPADDGFLFIQGGSFLMGSPDTENWRTDDETQHEVLVGSFFMDPYETTQSEYLRLMGINPSAFTGSDLPVESISWLDAIRCSNAKSIDAGLTPVYSIDENDVTWDLSADGYRLPTEAEWEYACRAGTTTPFNTEKSLSAVLRQLDRMNCDRIICFACRAD